MSSTGNAPGEHPKHGPGYWLWAAPPSCDFGEVMRAYQDDSIESPADAWPENHELDEYGGEEHGE